MLKTLSNTRFQEVIWWGISLGLLFGAYFTAFGIVGEWYYFRIAALEGMLGFPNVANPPYIALYLYPLALLPLHAGSLILRITTLAIFDLSSRLSKASRWWLLFSFPAYWVLAFNQLDNFVLLGAALGYKAIQKKNPYLLGISLLLLGVKPHIGGLLAIYYFFKLPRLKVFIIPLIVFIISFFAFGFWIFDYVEDLVKQASGGYIISNFAGESVSLYPFGILLLPLLALPFYSQLDVSRGLAAITLLAVPYAPTYSALILFAFPLAIPVYVLLLTRFVTTNLILYQLGILLVVLWPLGRVTSQYINTKYFGNRAN